MVRLEDNFYKFVNYTWLKNAKIPSDSSRNDTFYQVQKQTNNQLKKIVQNIKPTNHNKELIYKLYNSFLNIKSIEKKGLKPIFYYIKTIHKAKDKDELCKIIGYLIRKGVSLNIGFSIEKHPHNFKKHIVYFEQTGLGLPDEEFYRVKKYKNIRSEYKKYIKLLLNDFIESNDKKNTVYTIESMIAKYHMTNTDSRDIKKTINLSTYLKIKKMLKNFNIDNVLSAIKLDKNKLKTINISSPMYFNNFSKIWDSFDIDEWKEYIIFHIVNNYANYLPKKHSELLFDFYGKTLLGQKTQKPRWERGISLLNGTIEHALGNEYVSKHFSKKEKNAVVKIVENLKKAYGHSIKNIKWMESKTKKHALRKLEKMTVKIGYPEKEKSYKKLKLTNDLILNIAAISEFETNYQLAKLNKAPNKTDWYMGAHFVNAYFNPEENEIVFPAAILQKPFYSLNQSLAKNYGGIGETIGHEIGHCFDDNGSEFDYLGRVKNWWSNSDRKHFEKMTSVLINQYDNYSPEQLDNKHKINGKLTVGENIGDISGLEMAIKAYKIANPLWTNKNIKDIFFAKANCEKGIIKDELLKILLTIDPHSPSEFRVNGVVKNIDSFYSIFNIKKSDKMYFAPERRISIWK